MSEKEDTIEVDGEVISAHRDAQFIVKIPGGNEINCHVSGKIRKNFIKILPGDMVTIVISKYDMSKGRIIFRNKG